MTVAAVAGCSLTFLMRHGEKFSLCVDGFDLDDGEFLAMALLALHAFAFRLFENDHFFPALILENSGGNAGTL